MTEQERLDSLKIDLGISTDAFDSRLTQYLGAAAGEIAREGATLDTDSATDNHLITMYAAWLWRRRDNMEGMPRMLRYALNNRVFSEKGRTDG